MDQENVREVSGDELDDDQVMIDTEQQRDREMRRPQTAQKDQVDSIRNAYQSEPIKITITQSMRKKSKSHKRIKMCLKKQQSSNGFLTIDDYKKMTGRVQELRQIES